MRPDWARARFSSPAKAAPAGVACSRAPVCRCRVDPGSNLTLAWPASEIGWALQEQTNRGTLGLGTNWMTVPGSTTTNQMIFPIDRTMGSAFFRLVY